MPGKEAEMWSDSIFEGLATVFFVCLVLAAVAGGVLVWAVPGVWEWIKPIIHAVTA